MPLMVLPTMIHIRSLLASLLVGYAACGKASVLAAYISLKPRVGASPKQDLEGVTLLHANGNLLYICDHCRLDVHLL